MARQSTPDRAAANAEPLAPWRKMEWIKSSGWVLPRWPPLGRALSWGGAGASETASGGARFIVGADGTVVDTLGANVPDAISLGRYPAYVDLGAQTGARTFSISDEVWNAMSTTEQGVCN
jgi:hypothetical protein